MGGVGFAHVGGYGFHLRWGEFANVGFFAMYIVFLIRWYVSRYFSISWIIFVVKNPLIVKFCL